MEKEKSMSTAFDSIKRGLMEAIEHAEDRAPETRKEYDALAEEFGMARELIAARARITENTSELSRPMPAPKRPKS